MGSHATKQRQPGGLRDPRKSVLKNKPEPRPYRPAGYYNTRSDPFATEVFGPSRDEPLETPPERAHPVQKPEASKAAKVHYENDRDNAEADRDGLRVSDTDKPDHPTNRRPVHRNWLDQDYFHDDYTHPQHRSYVPYEYGPQPYGRRHPGPYPYNSMPPSIYPYRPRRPRPFVSYEDMYRPPIPLNEQYRTVPIVRYGQRAIPISDRPPPYQAVVPIPKCRGNQCAPREYHKRPLEEVNSLPDQNGALTDRSDAPVQFSTYQQMQVPSLLSSDHLAVTQPVTSIKPASNHSIHEKDDDAYIGANLKFFRNQLRFRPNGETIDYIHKYWYGNYSLLEKHQNYMQWLFPLYDGSRVNLEAVPLRAHEAKHISEDPETRTRLMTSYLMMLDFFGFTMIDEETGKVERAANWKDRFYNLIRSSPNHSRITRILKSLGELGQSRLQTPFVMALFHEVFETKNLSGIPPVTLHHWLRSINDDFERTYVFKQFKQGLTRLEDERLYLTRKDNTWNYFEPRSDNTRNYFEPRSDNTRNYFEPRKDDTRNNFEEQRIAPKAKRDQSRI